MIEVKGFKRGRGGGGGGEEIFDFLGEPAI